MRLLQGIKPATGGDSARRLAALGWRLSTERAALEATAVASKEEVRSWRAAAIEQASAVLALGQVTGRERGEKGGRCDTSGVETEI